MATCQRNGAPFEESLLPHKTLSLCDFRLGFKMFSRTTAQVMTVNGFIELGDIESLNQLLVHSHRTSVIIFKHSNLCGVSSGAYSQMSRVTGTIGIVTVQEAREVSTEIEKRLGVPHESPQVLIVRNGKVVWSASHGQVRAEVVTAALAESLVSGV